MTVNTLPAKKREHTGLRGVVKELLVNKHLYLMMLPTVIWFVIFCYFPLYGITLAFKKYDFALGIGGSPFVGFENFKFLFAYDGIGRVFFNTIYLNVLFIVSTTVISVILAIMFSEIRNKTFKRVTQSIAILPHFVSWAVVSLVLQAFVGTTGLLNQAFRTLGMSRVSFYNEPDLWPLIFVILRIRQLGRQLAEVPTQGLRKLLPAVQQDEIGQLISAYNTMVDEMEHMLATQYDLGRAKAGAELKALQSQINPHFLYNTLDMVSWMAKKKETDKIQLVMVSLSQFYKLTLSGGRDVITLEEELRLCDAYMRIQQLRWEGAIDYMVEADDELLAARLPKITLQPLIENAIKHGIMQRGEARGSIIISATMEEEKEGRWMTLSVLDNGVGMENSEEMLQKGSGSHYGMKNIEQRLALFYDTDIRIQVDSETGLGTCVSMTLPIIAEEEVQKK